MPSQLADHLVNEINQINVCPAEKPTKHTTALGMFFCGTDVSAEATMYKNYHQKKDNSAKRKKFPLTAPTDQRPKTANPC